MSLKNSLLLKLKNQGCKKKRIEDDLKHYEAKIEAMKLILISISNDIYNSVDACTTAQAMWQRVERLMRGTDTYDDLFDYLQQFEKLINASRVKKLEKSHDPLALVAHAGSSSRTTSPYYVTHPSSVVDYDDDYQGDAVQNTSEDPLTSALILLARTITQHFSNQMLCVVDIRRPLNRVSPLKNSILSNTKKSSEKALEAKDVLCVSCAKNVLIPSNDKCLTNYKLNVHSKVRRALFTTRIAKSAFEDTTPVVSKTRFSTKTTQSESLDTTSVVSRTKIAVVTPLRARNKVVQIVMWIVDSRCSKHMIGDRSLLKNFVEKFIGAVRFGNDHFAVITGYGDYVQGNITVCHVYNVEGLGHNLFSIGQFYDSDLEVAFAPTHAMFEIWKEMIYLQELANPICMLSPFQIWLFLHLYNKTPYELLHDRKPNVEYFYVFGLLCYLTNDRDDLGKMKPKADIGIFIGYSKTSKEFQLYSRHTKKIMETIHIKFDELTVIASEHESLESVSQRFINDDSSAESMNTQSKEDFDNLFRPMYIEYFKKRSFDVSINSAAQQVHNHEDSPSTSSIIVKEQDASPIVTTSEEQTSPIFLNEADEFIQEDSADFNGNTVFIPYDAPNFEEAE
ncbi:integrase, catalytic region, zinc finger, CCHC-type containing protein [Tanacetum coccineum]